MEKSYMKGLMFAAGLCKTAQLAELIKVLPPPPGGPRGWMREWAHAAKSLRDREKIAAAQAAAAQAAAERAVALESRRLEPRWSVRYCYGSHSFSRELYEIVVEEVALGKGLTWKEATEALTAALAKNVKKMARAAADWDDFMNA